MAKLIKGIEDVRMQYKINKIVTHYESERFTSFLGQLTNMMEIEIINGILKQTQPTRLLEIGIGTGRISRQLNYFSEAVGVDASKLMLRTTKRSLKNSKWNLCEADIMNLPFNDESFDVVIVFHLIRHFNKDDRRKAYQEIHRVLQKDGFFVMEVLNKDVGRCTMLLRRIANMVSKLINRGEYYEVYDKLYTFENFEKELSESRFELRHKSGLICSYILYFPINVLSKLAFVEKVVKLIMFPVAIRIEHVHREDAKHCISWIVLGGKK